MVHPSSKVHAPLSHDLNLPEGVVCAVNSDGKSVFGTYKSSYEAAKVHKVTDYRRILRYLGMDKLVETVLGNFYFTAAPITLEAMTNRTPHTPKPIIVVDLIANTSTQYPSVTAASKAIKIHHEFITKHLDGTVFSSNDKKTEVSLLNSFR
jgi:NUMOD1 domain